MSQLLGLGYRNRSSILIAKIVPSEKMEYEMKEYKVVYQDITSVINRDLPKAVDGLQTQINTLINEGWIAQGGLATVQAGGSIYLLQAMVR